MAHSNQNTAHANGDFATALATFKATYAAEIAAAGKAAWLAEGARQTFRIADDELWGGANGAAYPVPPIDDFALLGANAQRRVLYDVVKIADRSVGQTATGDVAAAVAKHVSGVDFSPERSCDSFTAQYVGVVREKTMEKYQAAADAKWKEDGKTGSAPKLKTTDKVPNPINPNETITLQSIINDAVEYYRAAQFEPIIRKAIAVGRNRLGNGTKTTGTRKRHTAVTPDLDFGDAAN